uniref:(northern house mosquito) hypothetical protein n=1 Tax=Culex pipiens TaxID=7175 RepID=A0A8D8N9A6_CULPI
MRPTYFADSSLSGSSGTTSPDLCRWLDLPNPIWTRKVPTRSCGTQIFRRFQLISRWRRANSCWDKSDTNSVSCSTRRRKPILSTCLKTKPSLGSSRYRACERCVTYVLPLCSTTIGFARLVVLSFVSIATKVVSTVRARTTLVQRIATVIRGYTAQPTKNPTPKISLC